MNSRKFIFILACFVGLFSGASAKDSIDKVISGFDRQGLWLNGIVAPIKLSENAKPEEVLKAVLAGREKDEITFVTREMRKVKIGKLGQRMSFHAAIVEIQSVEHVVLFRYQGGTVGWWSRIY